MILVTPPLLLQQITKQVNLILKTIYSILHKNVDIPVCLYLPDGSLGNSLYINITVIYSYHIDECQL